MVVALVALFVALGGSGYAATHMPAAAAKHSKKGAKALTAAQVNAMIATYFAAHRAQLIGPKGNPGANGTNGTNGANGAPGANGATNVTVVRASSTVPAGSNSSAGGLSGQYATCPSGQRATGGGVTANTGGSGTDMVMASAPADSSGIFDATVTGHVPTQWFALYHNGSAVTEVVYVWAICAAP
jgi:hypothetical protein